MPRLRLPRRLDHGEEASLVEHLDELRQRLFIVIGTVSVMAVVGFVFHETFERWMIHLLPHDKQHRIQALTATEPFTVAIAISIYFAIAVSMPVILYQAWAYFTPAIDAGKIKLLRWLSLLGGILAIGGVVFGYFVVLPHALNFLTNFNKNIVTVNLRLKDYIGFCVHVLVAMAVVFELPVFMVGLTRLGILTTAKLKKNRRMGYFACGVVGMAVAPSVDPVTTILQAVPLFALYEGSIWLCTLLDRRARRLQAGSPALET